MAKAKKRAGKKKAAKSRKSAARRKPAAKRKSVKRSPAATPMASRPVVIPGAWPFPMGSKP